MSRPSRAARFLAGVRRFFTEEPDQPAAGERPFGIRAEVFAKLETTTGTDERPCDDGAIFMGIDPSREPGFAAIRVVDPPWGPAELGDLFAGSKLMFESPPCTAWSPLPTKIIVTNHDRVVLAMDHLRQARQLLKDAGAVRTVERVRRALKSADGARRHAMLEPIRQARQARSNIDKMKIAVAALDEYDIRVTVFQGELRDVEPGSELASFFEDPVEAGIVVDADRDTFDVDEMSVEGAEAVVSLFREGSCTFEDAVTDLILLGMNDAGARAALFETGEWLVDDLVWRGPDGTRWPVDEEGYLGSAFLYDPETCPSKHWNNGSDVCADCGENLLGTDDAMIDVPGKEG